MPSTYLVLAHLFCLFIYLFIYTYITCNRISITLLEMSLVYAYAINALPFALECVLILCVYVLFQA
jgi:hypothetical protein